MTLAAVADTGPLIHLAEIESLGLLTVFDDLFVPDIVVEELEAGGVPQGMDELSSNGSSLRAADERVRPRPR